MSRVTIVVLTHEIIVIYICIYIYLVGLPVTSRSVVVRRIVGHIVLVLWSSPWSTQVLSVLVPMVVFAVSGIKAISNCYIMRSCTHIILCWEYWREYDFFCWKAQVITFSFSNFFSRQKWIHVVSSDQFLKVRENSMLLGMQLTLVIFEYSVPRN